VSKDVGERDRGLEKDRSGGRGKGRIYGEEEKPRKVSRRLSGKESAKGATTACRSPAPRLGFPVMSYISIVPRTR
jgi:hypothetical protein